MKPFSIILFFLSTSICFSQSGFINDNPKIAYWNYGDSKTITIIINGGPGYDHTYLLPEWDTLSSVSKIVYYDQRGCGKSENSNNYSWIEHLKDLKKLKDCLSPNQRVILAGSSWGTYLALIYALYFPNDVKGLILSGFTTWIGLNSKKVDLYNYRLDSILNFKRSTPLSQKYLSMLSPSKATYSSIRPELNEIYDTNFKKRLTRISEEVHSQTYKSPISMPDVTFLGEIKVPTLIIKGGINCGISGWSEFLNKEIKGSELYIINNSCHDPWFSSPELFFPKCLKFINQVKHFSR